MILNKRLRLGAGTTLALACLTACPGNDRSGVLLIESNTSWEGTVVGQAVHRIDGSGNSNFGFGQGTICWTLKKTTTEGYLRTYTERGTITEPDRDNSDETTAPFGAVDGCNR